MNLLAGCIQMIMVHTYGNYLFKLDVFPDWAKNAIQNTTSLTINETTIADFMLQPTLT